jgi:hypothetical protein
MSVASTKINHEECTLMTLMSELIKVRWIPHVEQNYMSIKYQSKIRHVLYENVYPI